MKITEFIRTLISYFLIGIALLVFGLPMFIIIWLPPRWRYDNKLYFFLADCFYKAVVYATFNKLIIKGKENLPKVPAIFVANHESAFDIFVLGALCKGYPHVWPVWHYYLQTPFIGHFIKRMFVSVDTSDPAKAARSLIQIYRFIEGKKRHLLIFPEGGRYTDGTIHPFYEGFAIIARKTARPVIPVYMPNNGKIYPPFSFLIYSYPAIAVIGHPFYLNKDETDEAFTARVRQWFVDQAKG